MQASSPPLSSAANEPAASDDPAQYPEDWPETVAMTVACTMDPSCALAFGFGYFCGTRGAELAPASPKESRFKWLRAW